MGKIIPLLAALTGLCVQIQAAEYRVVFEYATAPNDDPATAFNESLYEVDAAILRVKPEGGFELVKNVRASILPDDLSVNGKINDGEYSIQLGFHKREGTPPTAADLIVKSDSSPFRPAIIVKSDQDVNCTSDDPNKTTMNLIHIHNGFKTERGSKGCLTIAPPLWADFIQVFLDDFTSLDDWNKQNTYIGVDVGTLVVRPKN